MVASTALAGVDAVARRLEPAGEQLLQERGLQRRRDYKYVLSVDQLAVLLDRLADSHAALWAGGSVLARYETLYFDTPDRRCFHDHRRGRTQRYKVRARSYADRQLTMLEVKRKRQGETVKERLPRAFRDHAIHGEGVDFVARHSPLRAEHLRPVLHNQFRRLTLLCIDAPQRITFDVDLSFSADGVHRHVHGLAIAEVKSSSTRSQTPALRAFADCGLRPQSMSKYCIGSLLVTPGMRANRFLPTLRRVQRLEAA